MYNPSFLVNWIPRNPVHQLVEQGWYTVFSQAQAVEACYRYWPEAGGNAQALGFCVMGRHVRCRQRLLCCKGLHHSVGSTRCDEGQFAVEFSDAYFTYRDLMLL